MRNSLIAICLLAASVTFAEVHSINRELLGGTTLGGSTNEWDLGVFRGILPDTIYLGATGTDSGDITGGVGARWKTDKYAGVGIEYRHLRPRVTFARQEFRMRSHIAGVYVFMESPEWQSFSLGVDVGGGVAWDDGPVRTSETWAASGRFNINTRLSRHTGLGIWYGATRLGSFRVSTSAASGRTREQTFNEGGIFLRFIIK